MDAPKIFWSQKSYKTHRKARVFSRSDKSIPWIKFRLLYQEETTLQLYDAHRESESESESENGGEDEDENGNDEN